jgi:hypothetical protein
MCWGFYVTIKEQDDETTFNARDIGSLKKICEKYGYPFKGMDDDDEDDDELCLCNSNQEKIEKLIGFIVLHELKGVKIDDVLVNDGEAATIGKDVFRRHESFDEAVHEGNGKKIIVGWT